MHKAFGAGKVVGIDLGTPESVLLQYLHVAGLTERIVAHFATNQADASAVRTIIAQEFGEPIESSSMMPRMTWPDPCQLQPGLSLPEGGRSLYHRGLGMGALEEPDLADTALDRPAGAEQSSVRAGDGLHQQPRDHRAD